MEFHLKFPKRKQREFISTATSLLGGERKLAKLTGIPKASISHYRTEMYNIPESRAVKIAEITNLYKYLKIAKKTPANWGQIKGGKRCLDKKRSNGTLDRNIKKMHHTMSKRMKFWHATMKKKNKEFYYQLQYERFKKVSRGYKYKTLQGEKVRNWLEKDVANILFNKKISYRYEPFMDCGKRIFFPDFVLDNHNLIVEVSYWKGYQKAYKLKRKIKHYKKLGYNVVCVIPKGVQKFYKCINSFIISTPKELIEKARVAQTI